jgi:hypothetical protein
MEIVIGVFAIGYLVLTMFGLTNESRRDYFKILGLFTIAAAIAFK